MRVPNHVPDSANLTPPYPTKPDEASAYAAENERQRANHNPRVGGSSPSSGIREAPQMRSFCVLGRSRGDVEQKTEPTRRRRRCLAHRLGAVEPLRGGPNPRWTNRPLAALATRLTLIHTGAGQDRSPSRVLTGERG